MKSNKTSMRVIESMRGNRLRYIIGILGMGLFIFLFQTILAYLFLDLFDTLGSNDYQRVLDSVIPYIIGFMAVFMVIPFFAYALNKAIVYTTGNIRKEVFDTLIGLPVKYFKDNHSASVSSVLTNDIVELENAYSEHLVTFLINLISGIGTTVVIFVLEWRLGLVTILLGLITLLINTVYARKLRKISTTVQENLANTNTKISNIISGLNVIRIFNIQTYVFNKFKRSNQAVLHASNKRVKKQSTVEALNMFTGMMGFAIITVFGGFLVIEGIITIGIIVAVTQLQNGIQGLVQSLGRFITNLQASLAAGDRVYALFDEAKEPRTYEYTTAIPNNNNALTLKDVSFKYDQDLVINKLNLAVNLHQTAALVGPSGGGKSTIFKLILQFYPLLEGAIQVEDLSGDDTQLKELRKHIAYVPQNAHLFNTSIRENIRYGNLDADDNTIVEAAKMANADRFIRDLEHGYDTVVGENGAKLSGGQRQRIAIARAIVKDAPLLLLDEATSALDNESEKLVQNALERLMNKKTSLVIAHRLSTIERADVIHVMNEGNIKASGNHATLIEEDGLYKTLYENQKQQGD
ncbi:MAG: ABC transporter ATP-binding protein [Bacillota bacterium]